jgi:hypothetical protein
MASRYRSRRRTRLKLKLAWCDGRAHSIFRDLRKGSFLVGRLRAGSTGLHRVGATRQEAERLIREAIGAHLEALREYRIAVPVPLHEIGEVEVTAA